MTSWPVDLIGVKLERQVQVLFTRLIEVAKRDLRNDVFFESFRFRLGFGKGFGERRWRGGSGKETLFVQRIGKVA